MRPLTRLTWTVAVLGSLAACSAPTPAATPTPTPSAAQDQTPSVSVRSPIGLAVTADSLWVASADGDALVRIDPATGKAGTPVAVGRTPLRVVADEKQHVWVSVFRAGKLVAIDPATGKVVSEVDAPAGPEGVAAGFGSIWLVRQDAGELTRVDPTGKIVGRTPVAGTPRLVATSPTHVWVSSFEAGTLTRVDPGTGEARTSAKICEGAQGLAVDAGLVWVTCTTGNEVVTVDAQTLQVKGKVAVPGEPDGITIHEGRVFVAAATGPTLVELAAADGVPAVKDSVVLGKAPALADRANVDVRVFGDQVWVSSVKENLVYRVPLA